MKKYCGLLMLGLSLCVGSAIADDLALIAITSDAQAAAASQICGQAFLRQGDRFLVSVSPENAESLRQEGVEVTPVTSGVDPSRLAVVFPDPSAGSGRSRLAKFSSVAQLGDGVRLIDIGGSAAASVQAEVGVNMSALTDWKTVIEYVPPKVALRLDVAAYPTDTVATLVSQDSLLAFDQKLEAYYTRYIWSDSIDKARDWMVSKLQAWGYTVSTPIFSYGGGLHYNVKAVKTGYAEPNTFIVIGGHYDSYNSQSPGSVFAPGADDDGSGTSLTLELARVFKNIPTRKSIIFMPFSAEEVGLVGSRAAAIEFKNTGTKVECMFNYDMVGYEPNASWGLNISNGPNSAYRMLVGDAIVRLTSITPYVTSMGGSSDHYSFYQQGFDIVDNIEHTFNSGGWHTNIDLSSRMNFPYFTQVAKMAAASVAIVANAGLPGKIDRVVDNGDGSSVTVHVSSCNPSSTYWVFHGSSSGVFTDSVPVPTGSCSAVVPGLTEGQVHYFGLFEVPSDGYRSIWTSQSSQTPRLYPRSPVGLSLLPDSAQISLTWRKNLEGDIDHYRVYRRVEGVGDWMVIGDFLADSSFVDSHIVKQIPYLYSVAAVDHDGYESALGPQLKAYASTFDGGPLIVDEFKQEFYTQPTQEHQLAWYDTLMGSVPYDVFVMDTVFDTLHRADVARFSSIIWDDDDIYVKNLLFDTAVVSWFLSHPTNMLIAGYGTIDKNSTTPVPATHIFRTQFGLSSFYNVSNSDFIGAKGVGDWPSVQIDPYRGSMSPPGINRLTGLAGTTVIYRYDSDGDNPANEDQPCGLAWETPMGKRVLLSFPLWNMTLPTVSALMQRVLTYFNETAPGTTNGDIDGSGNVDIADLSLLIDYLYISLTPLPNPSLGDVDHSCTVDIADVTAMISYLFLSGPPLAAPCTQ